MLISAAAAIAVAFSLSLPIVAPSPVSVPAPQSSAITTPTEWAIGVGAIGYQEELDACFWTRMDFDGVVPIVGAHNFCGGDIVLDMMPGQIVHLSGAAVDGSYIVTGDRQVFPGDDAIQATAGIIGPVILQTCYWDVAQGMRLVTLYPVSDQPRDLSRVA